MEDIVQDIINKRIRIGPCRKNNAQLTIPHVGVPYPNSADVTHEDQFNTGIVVSTSSSVPINLPIQVFLPPNTVTESTQSSPPMAHSLSTLLLLTLFFLPFISSTPTTTVYEILNLYSLPSGLLPDSVTSYEFDSDTGRFTVYLAKACYIQFDYLVYYDKKITGSLGLGSITDLEGIEVKKFFLWLDVNEIKVDLPPHDSIYFQIGFINKELDIQQFETVQSCKDNGLGCSSMLKMPTPTREVPTLLTE